MRARLLLPLFASLATFAVGCSSDGEDIGESENDFTDGSSEARAILAVVNTPITASELVKDALITRAAAANIVAHRDGKDATTGTADDDAYDDLRELDAVPEVGPTTLKKLYDYAKRKGLAGGGGKLEITFSPQPIASSHLARIADEIDQAKTSVDILMYSYSDANITAKLAAATKRGVKVRFVYEEGGADDRSASRATTTSMKLENAGADVRYVNKIMHHKVMIVDGPRDDLSKAKTAHLVTGSANWGNSAATRFDENTMFITNAESLVLQYQREFNLLWEHSKDFAGTPRTYELSTALITDAAIPKTPNFGVFFTSNNFTPKGTTFSTTGTNTVADALVRGIASATSSIHIASGHLRSRPVAEALIAKKKASPKLDIRVYLDNQEYLSKGAHDAQIEDLEECLDGAKTDAQRRNCTDKGFLFGYQVDQAGIEVQYKYYAYRWDYTYAPQMHHKYMVIDKSTLYSGSYNLSDNAEHGTFENMMVLQGPENAATIADYEKNFESIWMTGRDDKRLEALLKRVETSPMIPIVFDPMALTWSEVTNLKQRIRTNCPDVDSDEFRKDAAGHTSCKR